jgi:hypothetical protein
VKARFGPICAAVLVSLLAAGCNPDATGGGNAHDELRLPAVASDGRGDDGITLIPPGFERAAAGPSYLIHVRGEVFAAVDPIDREVIFLDKSGKQLGLATIPGDFEIRNVDLGATIVLRGDDTAVEIPRSGQIPAELATVRNPSPTSTVTRAGDALNLTYEGRDGPGTLSVTPHPRRKVLAATFIGLDRDGNPYAYWEEGLGQRVEAWAGRVGTDGRRLLAARLDLSGFADIPALPVAVTPSGSLLLMRPEATSLELVELKLEEGRAEAEEVSRGTAPTRVMDLGDSVSVFDDSRYDLERTGRAPPPYDPVFAAQVLTRARGFLTASWTLRPANFQQAAIPNNCVPAQRKYWKRPWPLAQDRVGRTVTALPYKWGGFDSVAGFQQKLASSQPSLAGDVCTCREDRYSYCIVPKAAGVDCSGFVSRAWGLPSHNGTSQLGSLAGQLASLNDLKPGDALNRPGNHVRLFVRFEPGPEVRIRTLESAVSCGGVCENVYTPAQLQKYRPIRFRRS